MISLTKIQDEIITNPSYIETILSELGHTYIKDRGEYYQTHNLNGDNNTAISIKKNTLHYNNYTRNKSGNLITLVQDEKQCNFPKALEFIGKWIGLKDDDSYEKIKLPFSAFYKPLLEENQEKEILLPEYSETDLPPLGLNKMFLNDGVSLLTQEKFNLRFDLDNNNICIPIKDIYSRLVGCKARNNDINCSIDNRWYAYLPFQKNKVVYGYSTNYKTITSKKKCIIVEAEKSVMIGSSIGLNLCLGIMGHMISNTQVKLIKSLNCEEIIVAFDEGVTKEEIEFQASKLLVDNKYYKNKVSYIYGGLPTGSKASPLDYQASLFKDLLKYNLYSISK